MFKNNWQQKKSSIFVLSFLISSIGLCINGAQGHKSSLILPPAVIESGDRVRLKNAINQRPDLFDQTKNINVLADNEAGTENSRESTLAPVSSPSAIDASNSARLMTAIGQRTDLSAQAKSISVISDTESGSTILRGTVLNDRERETIGSIAAQQGLGNIKNELTVSSNTAGNASGKSKKAVIMTKTKKQYF